MEVTETPVMCPWAYRMEECIGSETPQCVQQCQNERTLVDARDMKALKQKGRAIADIHSVRERFRGFSAMPGPSASR